MSTFTVPVVRVAAIEPIPGADAIELAVVGDYRSVVKKGSFSAGSLAAYMPEASVLPDSLIETMGLTGMLAGSKKNRIKAIRLRGCLSQGILFGLPDGFHEGADIAAGFGITKYEPTLPGNMGGNVMGARGEFVGMTLRYEIENYKAYPWLIEDGEEVEFTEKVHGTFSAATRIPNLDSDGLLGRDTLVYSKGLGAKGFVFADDEDNAANIYLQAMKEIGIRDRIIAAFGPDLTVHVAGEIYGAVQDLKYGLSGRSFALFDVKIGDQFLGRDDLATAAERMGVTRVPVVYRGPFSREVMLEHTSGKTVIGNGVHIREGIVITPVVERRHPRHGRVILKSVSADYLTRKGEATEFA
jgi:RNA ligase (TIGR02306 family)